MKNEIIIRQMQKNEVPLYAKQIIELDSQLESYHSFISPMYKQRVRGTNISKNDEVQEVLHWIKRGEMYILLSDGQLIAFIILVESEYRQCVFVSEIVVDKKFRSQGFGQRLLNQSMKLYKQKHVSVDLCMISVLDDNKKAFKMYKKYGFKIYNYGMVKKI